MVNLLKLEWHKIKVIFSITVILGLIYSCVIILPFIKGYSYNHNIEIWQESNQILSLIFPLIATLPASWLMYYERKDKFLAYTLNRTSMKKYLLSKWIISSVFSALLIFLISFIGLIFCMVFTKNIELTGISLQGYDTTLQEFAGYYLANNPYLYGFVLSLWRSIIGFIIGTLGFVLSLYIDNLFIIMTGPFVYSIIENYVLSLLGMPYYRLVTAFDPSILDPNVITVPKLLIGPFFLLLFIGIVQLYFSIFKKRNIYEIWI